MRTRRRQPTGSCPPARRSVCPCWSAPWTTGGALQPRQPAGAGRPGQRILEHIPRCCGLQRRLAGGAPAVSALSLLPALRVHPSLQAGRRKPQVPDPLRGAGGAAAHVGAQRPHPGLHLPHGWAPGAGPAGFAGEGEGEERRGAFTLHGRCGRRSIRDGMMGEWVAALLHVRRSVAQPAIGTRCWLEPTLSGHNLAAPHRSDVARRQRRRTGSAAAGVAAGNSAGRTLAAAGTQGYREFFIQTVPVAPNRFRPVNIVGEMVRRLGPPMSAPLCCPCCQSGSLSLACIHACRRKPERC